MNAFVTLVSSDGYLPGALAQVAALRDIHPSPPSPPELPFNTVCLVTPESLDVATIKSLRKAFDLVVGVEILEQDNPAGLILLGRPDLTTVLTKLHVFRLTQFDKIIFLDADVLPIRPLSHLFSTPHEFSAVPDVGWPDIFNSGVLVLNPGDDKFIQLSHLIATKPSWDGGDQGLLNEWRDGDWNRLSFTYNTTPTAAYTYAPAYERYGSQIKAIHFIGPNKPWKSVRTPGRQLASSSDSVQPAYDYDSLVDRWFDVYDRHYSSRSPQTPFQVKHYSPAWELPSTHTPPSTLDLDQLKNLAIQGFNASTDDPNPTQGAYKSLPIQGRVDLMRPKKPCPEHPKTDQWVKPPDAYIPIPDVSDRFPTDPFNYDETLSTPIARRATLDSEQPRWTTLPTPGPRELPPSPYLRLISLPPTPSVFAPTVPDFYASESEPEPLLFATVPVQHHGHQPEPRPSSPPMVSWNPALEPPPTVTPTPSTFPDDTYFANVWDHTPSRQNDRSHPGPSPPDSSGFFQPPAPSVIPDALIKQGHYRNVTGESYLGATPSPDRSKIKSVFPWEEKPRVLPKRVFPDSDAPPPSLFLSPGSQSQTSTTTPSTPETRVQSPPTRQFPLSPLGLPNTLNYVNAWDNIPSIQKYASRLVKPTPPPALAPAFEDDAYKKGRKKSWDERTEMSSRDGDDEDNADDEDEDESDHESARRRSRRGSVVAPKGKKKEYATRGVQTFIVEKRSQSVQVDAPKPEPARHSKRGSASNRRHWAPTTVANVVAPMTTREVSNGGYDHVSSRNSPPAQEQPRKKSPSKSPSASPTYPPREFVAPPNRTAVKPTPHLRTSIPVPGPVSSPPVMQSARLLPLNTTARASPTLGASTMVRRASNDSSIGSRSPASSFGPLSPVEGHGLPVPSPLRKGTRVWDPARGVDLFKRGSEEVLARFLKMGAWEDETR